MRWQYALIGLAVLTHACSRRTKDPLLAEVTTPLHVSVRVHELNSEGSCRDVTGFDRFACWFGSRRPACLYVELGDSPVTEVGDCALSSVGDRVLVDKVNERNVELKVDATGERVAVRSGGRWSIFYLEQGWALQKLSVPVSPGATFDWATIEPVEQHLSDLYALSEGDRHQRIARRMTALSGANAMIDFLVVSQAGSYADWKKEFDSLSAEGQQTVRTRLNAKLSLDGGVNEAPWVFLADHPELQSEGFGDQVVAFTSDLERRFEEDNDVDWAIEELYREHHPQAGRLACRTLEREFLSQNFTESPEYEFTGASSIQSATSLATIALTRTPCPWVRQWFDSHTCSVPLNCTVASDGGVVEPDDSAETQQVLCSAKESALALSKWQGLIARPQPDPDTLTIDLPDETPELGALYLAALTVQGEPPNLVRRARSFYPLVTPKGLRDLGAFDEPCQRIVNNGSFGNELCTLPLELTHFVVFSCEVTVDDARKQIVLRAVAPTTPKRE